MNKQLNITLHTTQTSVTECTSLVKHGDNLELIFRVQDGTGKVLHLEDTTVKLILKKSDSTILEETLTNIKDVTISTKGTKISSYVGSEITAALDIQATIATGVVKGEILIIDDSGSITTNTFSLLVVPTLNDSIVEESQDQIQTFAELYTALNKYIELSIEIGGDIAAIEAFAEIKYYIDNNLPSLKAENDEAVINNTNLQNGIATYQSIKAALDEKVEEANEFVTTYPDASNLIATVAEHTTQLSDIVQYKIDKKDNLYVHFLNLDISKGVSNSSDCSIIISENECILIDLSLESLVPTIVSYLKNLGVSKITKIILTHYHSDHTGGQTGLTQIKNNFDLSSCILYLPNWVDINRLSSASNSDPILQKSYIDSQISALGLTTYRPNENEEIEISQDLKVKFLNCSDAMFLDSYYTSDDYNNFSMLVEFTHGVNVITFGGDLAQAGQVNMVNNLKKPSLYKVQHHAQNMFEDETFLNKMMLGVKCVTETTSAKTVNTQISSTGHFTIEHGIENYFTYLSGDLIFISDGYSIDTPKNAIGLNQDYKYYSLTNLLQNKTPSTITYDDIFNALSEQGSLKSLIDSSYINLIPRNLSGWGGFLECSKISQTTMLITIQDKNQSGFFKAQYTTTITPKLSDFMKYCGKNDVLFDNESNPLLANNTLTLAVNVNTYKNILFRLVGKGTAISTPVISNVSSLRGKNILVTSTTAYEEYVINASYSGNVITLNSAYIITHNTTANTTTITSVNVASVYGA